MTTLRRVLGIGLVWVIPWLAFWALVMTIIGIVDPDSIDPGEPGMMLFVFGPMGLLSGIAFGTLLSIRDRSRSPVDLPVLRVAACGVLGTAIVQVAYLGHGDAGLLANIQMALLFSVVGGLVTMMWLAMERGWSRLRRRTSSFGPAI